MTNLTVGAGQQFSTLKAAIAASTDGDVLLIQPGTYLNDFATINTAITLKGVGGMVHMKAEASPSDGKAIFTVNDNVTFENFEFSGVAVPDRNGAGIRHQGGDLTVLNSYFHDNQTGILTNNGTDLTVTIRNSEFANNGIGDGYTHNIYANRIGKLDISGSYFHGTDMGHQIKSRAAETVVTDTVVADLDSTGSYSIDLPNGGKATLTGNVVQQGANSDNNVMVSFGVEGNLHGGSSLTMQDNTVINDMPSGNMVWNTTGISASISGTDAWGLTESQLADGLANAVDTAILSARPTVDGSSPWRITFPPVVEEVVEEIPEVVEEAVEEVASETVEEVPEVAEEVVEEVPEVVEEIVDEVEEVVEEVVEEEVPEVVGVEETEEEVVEEVVEVVDEVVPDVDAPLPGNMPNRWEWAANSDNNWSWFNGGGRFDRDSFAWNRFDRDSVARDSFDRDSFTRPDLDAPQTAGNGDWFL
jgi:hypothetical protein